MPGLISQKKERKRSSACAVRSGRISAEATAMSDYDTLLSDASQLPLDARIQLIEALWETVPEDVLPALSNEWVTEINRRSDEFDAGNVQTIPWEQIRSEALGRLKTAQ